MLFKRVKVCLNQLHSSSFIYIHPSSTDTLKSLQNEYEQLQAKMDTDN